MSSQPCEVDVIPTSFVAFGGTFLAVGLQHEMRLASAGRAELLTGSAIAPYLLSEAGPALGGGVT